MIRKAIITSGIVLAALALVLEGTATVAEAGGRCGYGGCGYGRGCGYGYGGYGYGCSYGGYGYAYGVGGYGMPVYASYASRPYYTAPIYASP